MAGICHIGKGRCKPNTGVIVYFCNCISKQNVLPCFIFLVQRKLFVFLTNFFFTHIPMNGSDCCVEPKPILPLTCGGKKDWGSGVGREYAVSWTHMKHGTQLVSGLCFCFFVFKERGSFMLPQKPGFHVAFSLCLRSIFCSYT